MLRVTVGNTKGAEKILRPLLFEMLFETYNLKLFLVNPLDCKLRQRFERSLIFRHRRQ
jgi:hypothetical protein